MNWTKVSEFPGYEATECGRVRSVDRIITYSNGRMQFHRGKELTPVLSKCGYYMFSIRKKNILTHRMIALAFIPNPENKPFVNHINGNKTDNRVENLEWCTALENCRHAVKSGLKTSLPGSKNPMAKLNDESIKEIRRLIKLGIKQSEIAKKYGVSTSSICLIKKGKNWPSIKAEMTI